MDKSIDNQRGSKSRAHKQTQLKSSYLRMLRFLAE